METSDTPKPQAMPRGKPQRKLKCKTAISSSAGDFEPGDIIPPSVPAHARNAWVRSGLAEYEN